jgi:hypothetical protein
MFYTYILAGHGGPVDFDRARLLMDRDLLRGSIKAMNAEIARNPPQLVDIGGVALADPDYGPQWIWDRYCASHWEKHGTRFRPDADPTWDR